MTALDIPCSSLVCAKRRGRKQIVDQAERGAVWDRRALWRIGLSALLAGCQSSPSRRGTDDGTVQRYFLEGEVVRADPAHGLVAIKHGPIVNSGGKVWMEPMTMEFPVPAHQDLALLKVGQRVKAEVCARQSDLEYWIEHVQRVKP